MGQKYNQINRIDLEKSRKEEPFKTVNVLLRGEMRIYAFLLFHIFHSHLKARKYHLLFCQSYKDSQSISFVKTVMQFSFAVIEVCIKAIQVSTMLAFAFIQTTVLLKDSECLLLLERFLKTH